MKVFKCPSCAHEHEIGKHSVLEQRSSGYIKEKCQACFKEVLLFIKDGVFDSKSKDPNKVIYLDNGIFGAKITNDDHIINLRDNDS